MSADIGRSGRQFKFSEKLLDIETTKAKKPSTIKDLFNTNSKKIDLLVNQYELLRKKVFEILDNFSKNDLEEISYNFAINIISCTFPTLNSKLLTASKDIFRLVNFSDFCAILLTCQLYSKPMKALGLFHKQIDFYGGNHESFNYILFYKRQLAAASKRKKSGSNESYDAFECELEIEDKPIYSFCGSINVKANESDWSDSFDDLGPEYWEGKVPRHFKNG